jgi:hypothetical protein
MTFSKSYFWVAVSCLFLFSLSGCLSGENSSQEISSVETSTSKRLSQEDRVRYIKLWNQPGISPKSLTWPSAGEGNFGKSSLLLSGIGAKLPSGLASRYGKDPIMLEAAAELYRKGLVRGFDTDMATRYFSTSFGRREMRVMYLFRMAKKCFGKMPKDQRVRMDAYFETGSNPPPRLVCEKNGKYSEKSLP